MNEKRPNRLERALEAFESGYLDQIVRDKRQEDFAALRGLVITESTKRQHRQRAIYALGRWGDARVVPDLVRILPKLDEAERITTIDALGRLGTKDALAAVTRYKADPSPQVRKFVVQALGRLGGPEAAANLRDIAEMDSEDWIRQLAVRRSASGS